MPRTARMRMAGIPLHVLQRGHDRGACFFAESDYRFYLSQLGPLSRRFDCRVHAYVLMTNHVHLLLTPSTEQSATLLMKHLGQRYVQYINREYQRHGTLWEGRFRSSFVDRSDYLFKCQRYIELNPVRAGIVAHPRDYPWSSYRANVEADHSTVVQPHEEYLMLGPTPDRRGLAYGEQFQANLTRDDMEQIRAAGSGSGFAVGNPRFQGQIAAMLGRRVTRLRQPAGLVKGQSPKQVS